MTWLTRTLSGLWGYLAVAAGAIGALAVAYFKGQKAGRDAVTAKAEKKARQTERKATKAMTEGLQREQDALSAARARRRKRLRERSK